MGTGGRGMGERWMAAPSCRQSVLYIRRTSNDMGGLVLTHEAILKLDMEHPRHFQDF